MYIELVEKAITNRGNIVELNQVANKPRDYECYMTLFPFDKNILEYVKLNKSVKGYKGITYVFPALFIDIDNENDLDSAHGSACELVARLINDYQVNPNDLMIYFSGRKGFHIGIPAWMIGIDAPEREIAARSEMFALELTKGIKDIDKGIYNDNRLFRTVNSWNVKGNLYKIPLTFDQLTDDVFQIKQRARNPVTDFVRSVSQKVINKGLNTLWNLSVIKEELSESEIKTSGLFAPHKAGARNSTAFDQAIVLLRNGINRHEVWNIINLANIQNSPPLPEPELRVIYESALKTAKINEKKIDVRPFGGFMNEWIESIQEEKNKISLKFPLFDHEMKGKLRGKLCCMIHYSKTKKSLLAQNITRHNVVFQGQRFIYSSMEMGVPELMSRFIDMAVEGEEHNGSYELEQKERSMPNYVRSVQDKISAIYGDKLLITPSPSLQSADYRLILDRMISEVGTIDGLVVDGLSMMGGTDDETALVGRHTKELKEVAKDYNIFIIAIVHTSKGEDRHHRDVSNKARGSEKIIDNCDFYICPSLLVEFSSSEDTEYEKYRGYVRLVNKRGSGNTINVIYDFIPKMLYMEQSSEDPKQFNKKESNSIL